MEKTLEQRIEELEAEVDLLTHEIQQTLMLVQARLDETPKRRNRWRQQAWVIALLNMLLAIVLFVNIHYYQPNEAPLGVSEVWVPWLQGFWLVLAFVWLVLQLYPLALLLEAEEEPLRDIAWRNAGRLFAQNPALGILATAFVLIVAIVSVLFPTLWLVLMFMLLVGVLFIGVRSVLKTSRRPQAE